MMAERISGEARGVVIRAQEQARRLGQQFIGCEHLLYGVAGADDAAGGVLRARGVTPERVEEQVARLIAGSRRAAAGSSSASTELDGGALGSIGIDLDAVRDRVEQAFGPGALERAAAPSRRAQGHLRVTRQARKCLNRSVREAQADPAGVRGSERLALNLLAMDASVPRAILAALGVSVPRLTAQIEEYLSGV
jgi:ATP-dependent Clp protease ATP-binding subunit ClpA